MSASYFLGMAIGIATANVEGGGGPFGAVVAFPDGTFYVGANAVTTTSDPTAHAEVRAIRAAAEREGFDLSTATLYTSCAPCPMCLSAALWARIPSIVYAASPEEAAAAGFDDAEFYHQVATVATQAMPRSRTPLAFSRVHAATVWQSALPDRLAPFEAWAALADRVDY